jgi:hypothetical protein
MHLAIPVTDSRILHRLSVDAGREVTASRLLILADRHQGQRFFDPDPSPRHQRKKLA